MRGEIQHRQRAKQIRDFSGLRFGNITPTDIDGFIDFRNELFVWIEAKLAGTHLLDGQRLALERACDAAQKGGIMSVVLVIEHQTRPDEDIDFAACPVTQSRYRGKWHDTNGGVTCRGAIEKLLEKAGIAS